MIKPSSRKSPPVEFLRQCFDYNQDSGILTWRKRPREHFVSDDRRGMFNTRYAGREAGGWDRDGYRVVRITFDGIERRIQSHRVAWVLVTGAWPPDEIDHINGDRGDNRLRNLRIGSRAENAQNNKLPMTNTSGFRGVWWDGRRKKWRAKIVASGRGHHLGDFGAPWRAYAAYLEAKARLHPFQPVPRS